MCLLTSLCLFIIPIQPWKKQNLKIALKDMRCRLIPGSYSTSLSTLLSMFSSVFTFHGQLVRKPKLWTQPVFHQSEKTSCKSLLMQLIKCSDRGYQLNHNSEHVMWTICFKQMSVWQKKITPGKILRLRKMSGGTSVQLREWLSDTYPWGRQSCRQTYPTAEQNVQSSHH